MGANFVYNNSKGVWGNLRVRNVSINFNMFLRTTRVSLRCQFSFVCIYEKARALKEVCKLIS